MTSPKLSADQLNALLTLLNDPDSPAFAQAVERLTALDIKTLSPQVAVALQARLEQVITHLSQQKSAAATQLGTLRQRNSALQAYNKR